MNAKITQTAGKGVGVELENIQILEKLVTPLHQWAKSVVEEIKTTKLSGHPLKTRTGKLKKGVKAPKPRIGIKGLRQSITSRAMKGGFDYARILEYGWRGKFKYMDPVIERRQKEIDNIIMKVLEKTP